MGEDEETKKYQRKWRNILKKKWRRIGAGDHQSPQDRRRRHPWLSGRIDNRLRAQRRGISAWQRLAGVLALPSASRSLCAALLRLRAGCASRLLRSRCQHRLRCTSPPARYRGLHSSLRASFLGASRISAGQAAEAKWHRHRGRYRKRRRAQRKMAKKIGALQQKCGIAQNARGMMNGRHGGMAVDGEWKSSSIKA